MANEAKDTVVEGQDPEDTNRQDAGDGANGQENNEGSQHEWETLDAFLATLDESTRSAVQTLVASHVDTTTKGLKTALTTEREDRKNLAKKLKSLEGRAAAGDESVSGEIKTLRQQIDEKGRQISFYEGATTAGVRNPRLAWLAVREDKLFDDDGQPDWGATKEKYPELFAAPEPTQKPPPARKPNGNAGAGTSNGQTPTLSMDEMLRASARGRTL